MIGGYVPMLIWREKLSLYNLRIAHIFCIVIITAISVPIAALTPTANTTDPAADAEYQEYLLFKKHQNLHQVDPPKTSDALTINGIGFTIGYALNSLSGLDDNASALLGIKLGVSYRVPLTPKLTLFPALSYVRKGNKLNGTSVSLENRVDELQFDCLARYKALPWLDIFISPYVAYVLSNSLFYSDSKVFDFDSYLNRVEYGIAAGFGPTWDTDDRRYSLDLTYSYGLSNLYTRSISSKTSGIGLQLTLSIKR
jgi:Outer membrane protein beta-barrel domain